MSHPDALQSFGPICTMSFVNSFLNEQSQRLSSRRILQVFNRYLNPGGEEKSVARIAAHLEQRGHSVTRFWRASEEWMGPNAPPRWQQLFLTWNNPSVLAELRVTHETARSDVWIIHNVLPVISLGVYRLARELNVPLVHWLHNYRPISPSGLLRAGNTVLQPDDPFLVTKEVLAGSWRGRLLTAWLALGYARVRARRDFENVKAWVAISEEMRLLFERAGFPKDRLHTLTHSWDIQPLLDTPTDQGYFLFLGRMVEEKGVRFLMELWSQPQLASIKLVMAGEGPLVDELRRTAPPNVCWHGYVNGDEKRLLIRNARAVLFPCLWNEPLGIVVYEAFEQARPVIGSDVGGLKDLIRDGETGRRLEPAQLASWTETIQRFAREPAMAAAMGSKGLEWLNHYASPTAWGARFDRILEDVLTR